MTQIIFEILNVHAMYMASFSCLCPRRDGRRTLRWILVTMYCKQCPSMTVTFCLTPYLVWIWLAVILQNIYRRSSPSGSLSRPPQRGRSVVMSKRNFDTLLLLRHRDQIDCGTYRQSVPHALRRKHISVGAECFRCESILKAKCQWQRSQQNARLLLSRTPSASLTSA